MALDIRNLRYFLGVAAAQSISRAADNLHIAQPALSVQMRQLEEEFGTQLLERTPQRRSPLGVGSAHPVASLSLIVFPPSSSLFPATLVSGAWPSRRARPSPRLAPNLKRVYRVMRTYGLLLARRPALPRRHEAMWLWMRATSDGVLMALSSSATTASLCASGLRWTAVTAKP